MKKLIEIAYMFFCMVSLCSCPYSSPHFIDETAGIYVEDIFLGNWVATVPVPDTKNQATIFVSFGKHTDTEYSISFTGYTNDIKRRLQIKSDSLNGTAFMSVIDNRQFLNIKLNTQVYIAECIYKNGKLSLLPLAEHFTAKMIFSTADLRNSISFHYKTRVHPILDDDFCLRDMVKLN
jgi:hypothetical protein